jgi:hypothetical protein
MDAAGAADDFDMSYIMGGFANDRRASLAPSMVAKNSQERAQQRSGPSWWPGRRASNSTIGTVDDTFTGLVRKYDQQANLRQKNWTFGKEKADGPRDTDKDKDGHESTWRGMRPGSQEVWRCTEVARFMLESMQQQSKLDFVRRTERQFC